MYEGKSYDFLVELRRHIKRFAIWKILNYINFRKMKPVKININKVTFAFIYVTMSDKSIIKLR